MDMNKPGALFEKNRAKMKRKKSGLRSPDAVVKSEQNASHQYYKRKKRKMTNIGLIKKGGKAGKTNIGVMRQTGKQTQARKKRKMTNIGLIKKGGKEVGKTNIGVMRQTERQTKGRK